MKNLRIIYFLSFCIVVFSCRPEPLEIEIPSLEPEVVVFSQIIPDNVMTISLTQTLGALDFSQEEGDNFSAEMLEQLLIDGAEITISYADEVDTLYEITNGLYSSVSDLSEINETYRLEIITDEGDILTAEDTMLPIVEFDYSSPIIERTTNDTIVKFDFKIVDNNPGKNWYALHFYGNELEDDEPVLELNTYFAAGPNVLRNTELLSDEAFDDDGVFEGTFVIPNINSQDSMVVTLSNISETYFRYLEIRKQSSNFFTELTKEPVALPTNINGGLGFFNTHYPDIQKFDLKDY